MSDQELIRSFESLTLDPADFPHSEHVRLAFAYLQRFDLIESLRRYRNGLLRLTTSLGARDKYHDTVTCGMVVIIHERMASRAEPCDWETFRKENPDLLRWRDGAFFEYYGEDVLESEVARRTFVLPGRVA